MFHSFALLCEVFTDTPNIAEMSLQVKWRDRRNSSLSRSTAAFGLPNDSAIFCTLLAPLNHVPQLRMRIERMVHMQTAVVFEEMSESVASIAGAIADAVREGISRTLYTQQPSQNAPNVTSSGTRQPGSSTPSTLYQRVSTITSGTSQHTAIPSRTQSAPIVSGDFHSDTTGRKRYAAPTMFRAKRSRKNDARPKVVTYLRDIFCLPEH